jgi:hypothetical protein
LDELVLKGSSYSVPLFSITGTVLCPGTSLPLQLGHRAWGSMAVHRALQAPPPLKGLILVVSDCGAGMLLV